MREIHYIGLDIEMTIFDYDSNPALTNKRLYLRRVLKHKRFKSKKEAENFVVKIMKLTNPSSFKGE